MKALAGSILLAGLVLCAVPAHTHTRSASYSLWSLTLDTDSTRAHVVVQIPQLELTRLPWGPVTPPQLDPELARYLSSRLTLSAAGKPCAVRDGPRALAASPGNARFEWEVACESPAPLEIGSSLLLEVASSHLHFARVGQPGSEILEKVLSARDPRWPIGPPSASEPTPAPSSLAHYVRLGIEHIFSGYDHLAFLFALILLAPRLRALAAIVTGFTIAHSITLALAVWGGIHPPAHAIEALIGLSIALVAAENAWLGSGGSQKLVVALTGILGLMAVAAWSGSGVIPPVTLVGLALFVLCYFSLLSRTSQSGRLRVLIAFVFGLLHGFGFAEVLSSLALPRARLVPALFGFNLGVELGQLGVIAILWPGLRWLRSRPARIWNPFVDATSAAICGLGVFWLVARNYG